jgi:hypothetical protein
VREEKGKFGCWESFGANAVDGTDDRDRDILHVREYDHELGDGGMVERVATGVSTENLVGELVTDGEVESAKGANVRPDAVGGKVEREERGRE